MLLEKKIAKILSLRCLTLSLAESCSGGLLAHRLTRLPGSSVFFKGGLVTYSNDMKTIVLGVPSALIKKNGAVSAPVAQKMAQKARQLIKTDLSVAITGIAGPGGSTLQKPVGLVFIAVAKKNQAITKKFNFRGTRRQIQAQATTQALKLLLTLIS